MVCLSLEVREQTCNMETSIAERTANIVRFSATGVVKSESKSRKALRSSIVNDPSITQCNGGRRADANAPRRELACASSSTDAIILVIGLPSSLRVSNALKRPMIAPLTRNGESMPRAWISLSMYRLQSGDTCNRFKIPYSLAGSVSMQNFCQHIRPNKAGCGR
jgi:hypothetical protein